MGPLSSPLMAGLAVYFFFLMLAHFKLPQVQSRIMSDYKERQAELKSRVGKLKEWEQKLRKKGKKSSSKKKPSNTKAKKKTKAKKRTKVKKKTKAKRRR